MVLPQNTRASIRYHVAASLVKLFIVAYVMIGLPASVVIEFGIAALGIFVTYYLWQLPGSVEPTASAVEGPVGKTHTENKRAAKAVEHPEGLLALIENTRSTRGSSIDLTSFALTTLPMELATLDNVTSLSFEMPVASGSFSGAALSKMSSLTEVVITGAPLTAEVLSSLKQVASLRHLRVSKCRCVVQEGSAASDTLFVTASDVFAFQSLATHLQTIEIPETCVVEIGVVDRVFTERKVIVLSLARRLAVGDVIAFSRTNHKNFDAGHVVRTASTVVDEIRTDDHRLLLQAGHEGCAEDESLVAVRVEELGKKKDKVVWLGRKRAHTD